MCLDSSWCNGSLFRNLDIITVQTYCLSELTDVLCRAEAQWKLPGWVGLLSVVCVSKLTSELRNSS